MNLLMGNRSKKKKNLATLLALIALTTSYSSLSMAQDDLLEETDEILNSEQIDIDAPLKRKTQAQKLEEMRKKLERENEEMVQKKIEDIRMHEEKKLSKKLKKAFQGKGLRPTSTARTENTTVYTGREQKTVIKEESNVRVTPNFGLLSFSTDSASLESKINAGLNIEAKVSDRFTVGIGLGYTTMELLDVGNSFGNMNQFNYSGFYNYYAPTLGYNYNFNNNFYNNNYYQAFGQQGREMNYRNLSIELNSKFFVLPDSKIRPYLGLGLNYNRMNLNSYTDNGQTLTGQAYTFNTFSLGNEEFAANYLGASVSFRCRASVC